MVESHVAGEKEFKPNQNICVIIRNWSFGRFRDWMHGKYPGFDKNEQDERKKLFRDLDQTHQDQEVKRMSKFFR
jgi:hypothetical protein